MKNLGIKPGECLTARTDSSVPINKNMVGIKCKNNKGKKELTQKKMLDQT